MAVSVDKKYRFVSPGVFISEIDNSQIPKNASAIGPVIIGRTQRGPAMVPVEVGSFSEFVEMFGDTVAGGQGGDTWRNGNFSSPMYATYAAQAWLRNSNKATIVRLLGDQHENATSGYAGWKLADQSAYGLFVVNSGSATQNGTLGAIFYCKSGTEFQLTGALGSTAAADSGVSKLFRNDTESLQFVGQVSSSTGIELKSRFNFNEDSEYYIRKVFNTNPILTNTSITDTNAQEKYFLGETFEENLKDVVTSASSYAVVLKLYNGTSDYSARNASSKKAKTGWIFSQDVTTNTGSYLASAMTKLFYFEDLNAGESNQRQFKINIQDIKASTNKENPYGTFSVVIRKVEDNDAAPKIVETFANCNLNPNSENYIARKIGDQFMQWSDSDNYYTLIGDFPNRSKFVRVVVAGDVKNGNIKAELLPFGFYLPPRPSDITSLTAAGVLPTANVASASGGITGVPSLFTGSIAYPKFVLRNDAVTGSLSNYKDAVWGPTYNKKSNLIYPDKSYVDLIRFLPPNVTSLVEETEANSFTLHDLTGSSVTGSVFGYVKDSRVNGTSLVASYTGTLDAGLNRFSVPMYGGFDGLDITKSDPFANSNMDANSTKTTNYVFYSVLKALGSVSDPERVETNLLSIPGITNASVTDQMIQIAENRADCLAIIDLPSVYTPRHESLTYGLGAGNTTGNGRSNLDNVVSTFKNRNINSSYACTYYPWVKIQDTINNASVWVPPSVVALGVFSNTDNKADPWFAPAGFTRGGLSEGAAGIPVVQVSEQLTARQRDKLYEVNINPIAQFPAEGIVVFGQKTLQVTRSALDRINVRRLMLFLKREVSRISARLLFDPNVDVTWASFLAQVNPLMDSVKARFGLDQYKVILDSTTTTPDLVDQNIMYAKIFIKPTKAIEFIAIDFVITNSGAAFED